MTTTFVLRDEHGYAARNTTPTGPIFIHTQDPLRGCRFTDKITAERTAAYLEHNAFGSFTPVPLPAPNRLMNQQPTFWARVAAYAGSLAPAVGPLLEAISETATAVARASAASTLVEESATKKQRTTKKTEE